MEEQVAKSSGFITPDSELGIKDFAALFGKEKAEQIWDFGVRGVQRIRNNINTSIQLTTDYQVQDSLFIASSSRGNRTIQEEYTTHTLC